MFANSLFKPLQRRESCGREIPTEFAETTPIAEEFIMRFNMTHECYYRVIYIKELKKLAMNGCKTAIEFLVDETWNNPSRLISEKIEMALSESLEALADACWDANILCAYAFFILTRAKFTGKFAKAIACLKAAAKSKGVYATEAAFQLATMYGSSLDETIICKGISPKELCKKIFWHENFDYRSEVLQMLAEFGCKSAHDELFTIEFYDQALDPDQKSCYVKEKWIAVEEKEKESAKNQAHYYSTLAFANLAKYGWKEMHDDYPLKQLPIYVHIYALANNMHEIISQEKIFELIKTSITASAVAGNLPAAYFLGCYAHANPLARVRNPLAQGNKDLAMHWYNYIVYHLKKPCKTTLLCVNQLYKWDALKLDNVLDLTKIMHRSGCAISAISLMVLAMNDGNYADACQYARDAISFDKHKADKAICDEFVNIHLTGYDSIKAILIILGELVKIYDVRYCDANEIYRISRKYLSEKDDLVEEWKSRFCVRPIDEIEKAKDPLVVNCLIQKIIDKIYFCFHPNSAAVKTFVF